MKTRKITSAAIIAAAVSMLSVQSFAADEAKVYVTISSGTLCLTEEEITVTDVDADGSLTINDAFICAHKDKFETGEEGYGSAMGDYGLYVTKLWGIENGGSYGYYVNNASAFSLTDPITDGDYINAFVYTDTEGFSDTYTYFDSFKANVNAGEKLNLKLSAASFDADWNPVEVPVSGASILIDSADTEIVTNDEGAAEITFDGEGTYVITAKSEEMNIVPPVCIVTVSAAEEADVSGAETETAANSGNPSTGIVLVPGIMLIPAAAVVAARKRK